MQPLDADRMAKSEETLSECTYSSSLICVYIAYPELSVRLLLIIVQDLHMSRDMTKPTKWVCAQLRLSSAWSDDRVFAVRSMGR